MPTWPVPRQHLQLRGILSDICWRMLATKKINTIVIEVWVCLKYTDSPTKIQPLRGRQEEDRVISENIRIKRNLSFVTI